MIPEKIQITKYEPNMTGWKKALLSLDVQKGQVKEEDKLGRLRDLINRDLPTYDYYFVEDPLPLFPVFYSKYSEGIVIRALPKSTGGQRKSFICETIDSAIAAIHSAPKEHYSFLINEYDPAKYSGVIVADNNQAMVEMVQEPNLEDLCHGHVVPFSAVLKNGEYSKHMMRYINTEDPFIRQLMFNAVRSVSDVKFDASEEVIPDIVPQQGYYEFVYSERDGKLRFIDYSSDTSI